jgi:hypothetical protein
VEEPQNILSYPKEPPSENVYRPQKVYSWEYSLIAAKFLLRKFVFKECKKFVEVRVLSFGPSSQVFKVFKW